MTEKDTLYFHLRDLPYFRAMLRAVESGFYENRQLPSPTLDVGCGDGHFASVTFDRKLDAGLDLGRPLILEAASRGAYRSLIQGDAGKMPFPNSYFASGISNSVLEHIPELDAVLHEISRVLKPEAYFYFCVPNHRFNLSLSGKLFLEKIGFRKLAKTYEGFYDTIARHIHLDSPEVWQRRLESHGLELEDSLDYFSPQALHVLEWGHLFGIPSLLIRKLTGQWNLIKNEWNFNLTRRLVQRFYDEEIPQANGVCTFYIARKG